MCGKFEMDPPNLYEESYCKAESNTSPLSGRQAGRDIIDAFSWSQLSRNWPGAPFTDMIDIDFNISMDK